MDKENEDYRPLIAVLNLAVEQAAVGKGRERHANNRPFDRQPIMEISRMVGYGYPSGQAMKKTQEAFGMLRDEKFDSAKRELLGAINYLAAAFLYVHEKQQETESK